MHATLDGVDAVCEGVKAVDVEPGVPLEGDLDLLVVLLLLVVAHDREQRLLRGVDVGDEVADSALVAERLLVGLVSPLVVDLDLEAPVEERHHLEPLDQGLEPEGDLVEDRRVGPEPDNGAGSTLGRRSRLAQSGPEQPAVDEVHVVAVALAVDLNLDQRGKGVDDRDADAVEAARDLVALSAELAAGVENGEDDLGGRHLLELGVPVDGNSTPVVAHLAPPVGQESNPDDRTMAGHGLVDAVVDDLPDKVVQAGRAGRPDVHAGPLPNGLQPLEDSDVDGAVRVLGARHRRGSTGCEGPGFRREGRPAVAKCLMLKNRRSEGMFTTCQVYQPNPRIDRLWRAIREPRLPVGNGYNRPFRTRFRECPEGPPGRSQK